MTKNIKSIFFVLTLVTLLATVGAVCAADDANSTIAVDSSVSDATISNTASDTVAAEPVTTKSNDNNVDTKTIEKEEKQIKTTTKTIEVNDGTSLSNAITQASTDTENDEYIINLNEGSYELTSSMNIKSNITSMIINGNGQTINTTSSIINRIGSLTLKDLVLNIGFGVTNRGENLTLINSSLTNCEYTGISLYTGNFIIDEKSYIDPTITINLKGGNIISNNTAFNEKLAELGIYLGENTIENQTITTTITNGGNLTLRNCILNSQITNGGTLTLYNCTVNHQITNNKLLIIDDDTTFQTNAIIINGNDGKVNINDINKIVPYVDRINGTYTISNLTIGKYLSLCGDIVVENCIIKSTIQVYVITSIVTFKNCTINTTNGGTWLENRGIAIINDDTTIIQGAIDETFSQGIIYGERPESFNPTTIDEDQTIENMTFTLKSTNNANLTLVNCNITAPLINQGNLTFENCLISKQITNNANMTFINCSFSNNNMTTAITDGGGNYGFLLQNGGNASLIGCVMENNFFNATFQSSGPILYGAIFNNGSLSIVNSTFRNNTVGYQEITGAYNRGNYLGRGSVVSNMNGTLTIEDSTFDDNYAGEFGGAIYNEATLTVTNSNFTNNTAGREGGAICTSGNAMITGSDFTKNQMMDIIYTSGEYIGGGAISTSGTTDIKRCTFSENYAGAPEGLAGVKADGAAIGHAGGKLNIEDSTFTNHTVGKSAIISCGSINITNCLFENNTGDSREENSTIIHMMNGLNLTGSTFKNNVNTTFIIYDDSCRNETISGIWGSDTTYYHHTINGTFANNHFIDNNATVGTIFSTEPENMTKINNIYINTTIDDEITLNIPNKIYVGEEIEVTGTYNIKNSEDYDENIIEQNTFNIYVNQELKETTNNLAFNITPTVGNMIIIVEPSISNTRKATVVKTTTLTNITITPENYDSYVFEGSLIGIDKDTKITFNGTFTDKTELYLNIEGIILDGSQATFTNTVFILDAPNIVLQNFNITNIESDYPIQNLADNNIINNNTVTLTNTRGKTAGIYNTASNAIISNNTLNIDGASGDIDFTTDPVASTQAILLRGGDNNLVTQNNITIKNTGTNSVYGTIEGITNSLNATNTIIEKNTLNVTGGNFNYAIDCLQNVQNITIKENTILVTGERYCDGIQVGNGAQNIYINNNNITCICLNTTPIYEEGALTYGVIALTMGNVPSENITINENNINLTGTANYAIELYIVDNTEIHDNNITVNGPFSLGIGYCYSTNGNTTGNTIIINGDSTTPINHITEEIIPENTGIRVQNGTANINIENNTIITSDIGNKDSTINSDVGNVTIKNNELTSSIGYGQKSIKYYYPPTMINNTVTTITEINDINTIINTPTTITVTVTDKNGNKIHHGTVTFKDADDNIITETTIINGEGETTVTFKEAKNTTITATFKETMGLLTSNDEANLVIKDKFQTTITFDEITATAGETIIITANVQDENGDAVTAGKVTFKVNGKTLKDANGKVIYAKVVDGVATATYEVPMDASGKDLNITAVYSGSSKYDKQTTTTTVTVEESTPTLTITPFNEPVTSGSTVTLKAKVALGDTPITTGKIVFKINGKTVKDANGKVIYAKVDSNGEVSVDYTIPESFKAGTYNIEAVFTASGYEKLTDNTTMTVVKS